MATTFLDIVLKDSFMTELLKYLVVFLFYGCIDILLNQCFCFVTFFICRVNLMNISSVHFFSFFVISSPCVHISMYSEILCPCVCGHKDTKSLCLLSQGFQIFSYIALSHRLLPLENSYYTPFHHPTQEGFVH